MGQPESGLSRERQQGNFGGESGKRQFEFWFFRKYLGLELQQRCSAGTARKDGSRTRQFEIARHGRYKYRSANGSGGGGVGLDRAEKIRLERVGQGRNRAGDDSAAERCRRDRACGGRDWLDRCDRVA